MRFKLLKSRRIFRARVFELEEETWRGPGTRTFQRHRITHPGAVAILPYLRPGRLVLIRQFRSSIRKTLLEIPAGTLEPGERPLSCAKRELQEEIGFAASRWRKLGAIYTAPGFCSERIHLYRAWGLTPSYAEGDEDEHIERVEMSLGEVRSAIRRGLIQDAKTLSALIHVL